MSRFKKRGRVEDEMTEYDAVKQVSRATRHLVDDLNRTDEFADEDGVLDSSMVELKPDHEARPFWVLPNGVVLLEALSPLYNQAADFLIAIAEPVSRPDFVHEYRLDKDALFGAVSMGLSADTIVAFLGRLSKVPVPKRVENYIHRCTVGYGKVKLVLRNHRYLIESAYASLLRELNKNKVIQAARVHEDVDKAIQESHAHAETEESLGLSKLTLPGSGAGAGAGAGSSGKGTGSGAVALFASAGLMSGEVSSDEEDMETTAEERATKMAGAMAGGGVATDKSVLKLLSFEIKQSMVEEVKKECLLADPPLPMLSEYDFNNDLDNPALHISLRHDVAIRSYQAKSLSKVFGNQRARSGVIVLPCGAGKTLVGITAVCTIRKSALVLCPNVLSVEQWMSQFGKFTTVAKASVKQLTSKHKEPLPPLSEAVILISTYSMMGFSGKRSEASLKIMEQVRRREWGVLVMDEVHMMPAASFRRVISNTKAHCRLGLTATLVREDNLIDDLMYLIGPKMYEANWMDLTKAGFLANAQCIEVWCPMTPLFYREYLRNRGRRAEMLYVMNPHKLHALEHLLADHRARGDKIIVFSDNVFSLWKYAEMFECMGISGKTDHATRTTVLEQFRSDDPDSNVLFLSQVGDLAIDVPDCNVIIQISSHFGSRRQEAQRLGRILRKKPGEDNTSFNAFFYTLISTDTVEMHYSNKRRQYLVDQGYAFKVLNNLFKTDRLQRAASFVRTDREEAEWLEKVLAANPEEEEAREAKMAHEFGVEHSLRDDAFGDDDDMEAAPARRRRPAMASLSGGTGAAYLEVDREVGGSGRARKQPRR